MAFPTTRVLDDFARADGPVGGQWTDSPDGTAYGGMTIVGGVARPVGGTFSYDYWNPDVFGPDCEVFVTEPVQGANIDVLLRLTSIGSGSVDGYALRRSAGNTFNIHRIDNDVYTQLGASITETHSDGDSFGIEAKGTRLTAYHRDGAGAWAAMASGSRTDGTYTAAGNLGTYIQNGAGRIDDFGGGTRVPSVSWFGRTVTDDFNRADGAIAGANGWAAGSPYADSTPGLSIVSNRIYVAAGQNGANYRSAPTSGDYAVAACTIGPDWGSGCAIEFLMYRDIGASFTGYSFVFSQSGGWEIREASGGSDATIASGFYAYVSGDQVGCRIQGHNRESRMDEGPGQFELGMIVDPTVYGPWYGGIWVCGGGAAPCSIDDFIFGDLPATGERLGVVTRTGRAW